ncbi:hypothetical protein [Streptomyces sp. NPDC002104]
MKALDSTTWEAALVRLVDDVYTFARSGLRLDEDGAEDVLAVMERSVADPRGCSALEWQCGQGGAGDRPSLLPVPCDDRGGLPRRGPPDHGGAAVELLASLTQEWFFEGSPVRSREDRDTVPADARTVLGRFGPDAVSADEVGVFWSFNAN